MTLSILRPALHAGLRMDKVELKIWLFSWEAALELPDIDVVLANHLPESPAVFLGGFGGSRDISVVQVKESLDIVALELGDAGQFCDLEVSWRSAPVAGGQIQIFALNHVPLGEHDRARNQVLELPHVPRPIVILQHLHGVGREGVGGFAKLQRVFLQKMAGQRGNIVASLAQRRQVKADHIQPIVEVLSQPTSPNSLVSVDIGGGDHAHIGCSRFSRTERAVLFLLQDAEQFNLSRQRKTVDLIQKQCSAFSLLQQSIFLVAGAGERPRGVTKQFVFDQFHRNGPAIERYEWMVLARTEIVNGAGADLLAGSG